MSLQILNDPPEGWKSIRFRQILESTNYGTSEKMNINAIGIPILRIPNVIGGKINFDNLKYCELKDSGLDTLFLRYGDILVVRTNGNPLYVGRCALYKGENNKFGFASYLIRLRYDMEIINPNFLIYLLQSELVRRQFRMRTRTSAGNYNINTKGIQSIQILIPPTDEQSKIINILSNVDNIIQQTQQLIEQLKLLKKGLMQRLFTQGVGHTEFQETRFGRIPKEWEIIPFTHIIKTPRSKVDFLNQNEYLDEGEYPIVDQGQDFIAGYSNDSEKVYNRNLPIIIFGDHTRIFKYIDFPFICGAQGTKVLLPNVAKIKPLYCYYILSNLRIKSQGYSRHYRILKEQLIKVPKPEEQNKISSILKNLDDKIANETKYVSKLKDIKKGLMQQLLTGKKKVSIN